MPDWRWLNEPGNVGELSVDILENHQAKFLLDSVEDTRIGNYEHSGPEELSPGDACIMKAEILEVVEDHDETVLEVKVVSVEIIQKAEMSNTDGKEFTRKQTENSSEDTAVDRGRQGNDRVVQSMMKHLETARKRRTAKKDASRCANCRTVSGSTDVTIEEQISGRDLHYCSQCNRLLSTQEYQHWKNEHQW